MSAVFEEDITNTPNLSEQISDAQQRIMEKSEQLRQLKLARTYRQRAETKDLDDVTKKWKQG